MIDIAHHIIVDSIMVAERVELRSERWWVQHILMTPDSGGEEEDSEKKSEIHGVDAEIQT